MTGRSSCPECGTILRIRDRSFVGRKVNCPECKAVLRIESAGVKGEYVAKTAVVAENVAEKAAPVTAQIAPANPSVAKAGALGQFVYSPLTAAWLLAIAVLVLIGVLTLGPKYRFSQGRTNPGPQTQILNPDPQDLAPKETEADASPPADPKADPPTQVVPSKEAEELIAISALEPANVEGSLPWPPPVVIEEPVKVVVKIDVAAKMAQKIVRYAQPKVRRRDLLDVLEEQLGAPIRYDENELGTGSLDDTITFDLSETTIGGVIQLVADMAQWDVEIEDTGLRLKARQPIPTP